MAHPLAGLKKAVKKEAKKAKTAVKMAHPLAGLKKAVKKEAKKAKKAVKMAHPLAGLKKAVKRESVGGKLSLAAAKNDTPHVWPHQELYNLLKVEAKKGGHKVDKRMLAAMKKRYLRWKKRKENQ